MEIQEQTFNDIAREIHDNISLSLTLAKLQLNTTDYTSNEAIKETIDTSIGLITKSITDLSDISRSLNSELIHQQGLIKALQTETQRINKSARVDIKLTITGEPVFLSGAEELFIFRIVQESVNNVLKHAHAKTIDLNLHYNHQKLEVTIKDDGVGFDTALLKTKNGSAAGLSNIKNRAKLFNGNLEIKTASGKGTELFVSIPYAPIP